MPTANMNLDKPVVSSTAGPAWETLLNAIFDLIDAHDHSSGKGVLITQAGVYLTDDLSFRSQSAKELESVAFDNLSAAGPLSRSLYVRAGELWFKDADGTEIQLTDDGTINFSLAGGFTGDYGQPGVTATAVYTNATSLYEFLASTGPSVYANLKFRDLVREGAMKLGTDSVSTISSSPTTITDSDHKEVLLVDTSAARTINLPAASASKRVLRIKDKTGSAMTNNISVVPAGSDTIEGLNVTKLLATNWGSWTLVSDGTSAWYLL
jgi:hypothetical protein